MRRNRCASERTRTVYRSRRCSLRVSSTQQQVFRTDLGTQINLRNDRKGTYSGVSLLLSPSPGPYRSIQIHESISEAPIRKTTYAKRGRQADGGCARDLAEERRRQVRAGSSEDQVHPREPGKRKLRRMKRRQMLPGRERASEPSPRLPSICTSRIPSTSPTLFAHECVAPVHSSAGFTSSRAPADRGESRSIVDRSERPLARPRHYPGNCPGPCGRPDLSSRVDPAARFQRSRLSSSSLVNRGT